MKKTITIFLVTAFLVIPGCASKIDGIANTIPYGVVPNNATFLVRQINGDSIVGAKLARMIKFKLEEMGYVYSDSHPDLVVSFSFDVVPSGVTSSAYTLINSAPTIANAYGNSSAVMSGPTLSTSVTSVSNIYTKTIAIRISSASVEQKLWDGIASETGWCNQIFVTAPQIITLIFTDFPKEKSNLKEILTEFDEGPIQIRKAFPEDTDWGCSRS